MQASSIPAKFQAVFANQATSSYIRSIPLNQSLPGNGAASLNTGFPPETFVPPESGGFAPDGRDVQGILNPITAWAQWIQAGGAPITYDATFQSEIGGYFNGSVVASAVTPGLYWRSTADNNMTNPDTGGAGWVAFPYAQEQLAHGECVLLYSSATAVILKDRDGENLLIGGVQEQVPVGGVAAGNTGVWVNGSSGQNLAASTAYYVSASMVSGTMTLQFWALGTYSHAPDTTAGNVGVEVIWTTGGSPAPITGQTLVGMVQTNASAQFQSGLLALSWFNRHDKSTTGNASGLQTGAYSYADLGSAAHVPFLVWGDECAIAETDGFAGSNTGAGTATAIGVDSSSNIGGSTNGQGTTGSTACSITCEGFFSGLSEGLHTAIVFGLVTSGSGATGTWSVVSNKVQTRG